MRRRVLTAGAEFGHYRIRRLLGAGAMAEVYLATNATTGRDVAVKVLRPGFGDADARLRRFEREARAMAATNHPNVVAIYEVDKIAGKPFIAMEYVDGPTLREVLDDGGVSLKTLLDCASQMAQGLEAAHLCGIVHRDLKPENVMLASDGVVKILDFGLSKPLSASTGPAAGSESDTHEELTLPGTILGTLEYMSPEQASGYRVGYPADQFALGSILYELITGQAAFRRDTTSRVLAAVIEGEPEPLDGDVPDALRLVVTRCLRKAPEERFGSMSELVAALEAVKRRHGASPSPWLAVGAIALALLTATVFL